MANRYWVGGTATWNATASLKWATTSGGVGGAAVPTAADDVFFDGIATGGGAAGAITVTVGAASTCKNLNFTGFAGTFAGASTLAISASFTGAGTLVAWTYSGAVTFNATTAQTITSAGIVFLSAFTFNGVAGSWQLQDAFSTTLGVTLTNGGFDFNGQTFSAASFTSNNANVRTITIGTSQITLTGTGTVWNTNTTTNLTFSASASSKITINNASASSKTFTPGGQTFGDFSFTGAGTGSLNINGTAPVFQDVSIANSGGATYTQSVQIDCRDLIFTGFTGTWAGTSVLHVSRDFTLVAAMTRSFTGPITFNGTGTSNITSNTVHLASTVTFDGVGGHFVLQDAFFSTASVTLTNGHFDTNGKALQCSAFVSSNANVRTLTIAGSTVTLTFLGAVWNTSTESNLTLNASGSTIKIDNTGGVAQTQQFSTVSSGAQVYGDIQLVGTGTSSYRFDNTTMRDVSVIPTGITLSFLGSNIFRNLTLTGPNTLVLGAGLRTTVQGVLAIAGTIANVVTLKSQTAGVAALFDVSKNNVVLDYMSIQDVKATGGARWFAGRHSTNVSGNNGWRFTDPYRAGPSILLPLAA